TCGTKEQLKLLSDLTVKFLRGKIADCNLHRLRVDDYSLKLTVTVKLEKQLGVKIEWEPLERSMRSEPGIWVRSVTDTEALADSLGGSMLICQKGFAILALNGQKIYCPNQLVKILGKWKKSKDMQVNVTLCFSKHADLSGLPDEMKRTLKFGNGDPFDEQILRSHLQQQRQQQTGMSSSRTQSELNVPTFLLESSDEDDDGVSPPEQQLEKRPGASVNSSRTPSAQLGQEKSASSLNSGMAKYDAFEAKYKHLVPLEFSDAKIHTKKIFSTMWGAHKQLFGPNAGCDDKCKCIERLPTLVANVIANHADDPGVRMEGKIERKSTGVMEHFVPRFIDLLKDKYPSESPS
ncbi:MAG: hypothetical protein SGILL_008459, partial [Bacillariaceae sp.]